MYKEKGGVEGRRRREGKVKERRVRAGLACKHVSRCGDVRWGKTQAQVFSVQSSAKSASAGNERGDGGKTFKRKHGGLQWDRKLIRDT